MQDSREAVEETRSSIRQPCTMERDRELKGAGRAEQIMPGVFGISEQHPLFKTITGTEIVSGRACGKRQGTLSFPLGSASGTATSELQIHR